MTIDEAMKKYKCIANTDSSCPRYCMCPCEECVQECKQLAEWLEELKELRKIKKDYATFMYNKAIDDLTEKLNAKCDGMIKEQWNSNVAPISWAEAYADFKDDIDKIAEYLKAGGENGNI